MDRAERQQQLRAHGVPEQLIDELLAVEQRALYGTATIEELQTAFVRAKQCSHQARQALEFVSRCRLSSDQCREIADLALAGHAFTEMDKQRLGIEADDEEDRA